MKHAVLFLLALTGLVFSSCKEDDEGGSLTIHFKALYEDQPLTTFSSYPFAAGEQIQFSHLSWMCADLALVSGGTETPLSEIALVDLSFSAPADANEGMVLTISDIDPGTYSGIKFGFGVPPDLNAMKPADFPSSSPLSSTSYYWHAWSSYIFSKTEGKLDVTGTGTFDTNFALHTGADPLYRTLEAQVPISITAGGISSLDITVDYKDLLNGVDIKANPQNHNPGDSVLIKQMVSNLSDAIRLAQ